MNDYQIITDSGADLPEELVRELDVRVVPLSLLFRGEFINDSVDENIKEIYAALRNGENASTTAVNPLQWQDAIEPYLRLGRDVLVLPFSSGLSTTCSSALMAAEELRAAYPERKIRVVDTLGASLGQGLLVWYACKKRDGGADMDSLALWMEETKSHLCHWFTVDDLMFLKRGGRIGAVSAIAGTALNIKPILHVDNEGRLVNVGKTRGRKASLRFLLDKMAEIGWNDRQDAVFISHGDCPEDAEYLKSLIRERLGIDNVFIGYTGAVIGSHSGPGTVALFYLGRER